MLLCVVVVWLCVVVCGCVFFGCVVVVVVVCGCGWWLGLGVMVVLVCLCACVLVCVCVCVCVVMVVFVCGCVCMLCVCGCVVVCVGHIRHEVRSSKKIIKRTPLLAASEHYFRNQAEQRYQMEVKSAGKSFGQEQGGKYKAKMKCTQPLSGADVQKASTTLQQPSPFIIDMKLGSWVVLCLGYVNVLGLWCCVGDMLMCWVCCLRCVCVCGSPGVKTAM